MSSGCSSAALLNRLSARIRSPVRSYSWPRLLCIFPFCGFTRMADVKRVTSENQSLFRDTVFSPCTMRMNTSMDLTKERHKPAFGASSKDNPKLTSMQNPMLGMYRILSATTKPTGKKRLEAGMKGKMIRDRATRIAFFFLSLPFMA